MSSTLPASWLEIAHVPPAPSRWAGWSAHWVNLVFPVRCAGCQQPGASFCEACQASLQALDLPACRRCGRPIDEPGLCRHCQSGSFSVSAIRSPALYAQPLSAAIRQFKYGGRRDLAGPLGRLLSAYWLARKVSTDLVMAVPLHKQRLRERGFNQARLLAMTFCRETGLPLLDSGWLRRERDTAHQARLNLAARSQNVAGAFAWYGPRLDGVRVLLIDDVATTGSTLEACGAALKAAGAERVWALTVARAALSASPASAAANDQVDI